MSVGTEILAPSPAPHVAASASPDIPPLVAGDCLTQQEFLRRYESMPHIRKAELIGGIVYMPSPVSIDHSENDNPIATWMGVYAAYTPGTKAGSNATWRMLQDAPQPDDHLRILPEYGGQSRVEGKYGDGAPELLAEIALSSSSYDLHQKLDLYRSTGVLEYIIVLLAEREVRWLRRVAGTYQPLPADERGIVRSVAFPGLWLDTGALVSGDVAQVLAVLNLGLQSREHVEFVQFLAQRRSELQTGEANRG
jgi:Uma2 family endonuclease